MLVLGDGEALAEEKRVELACPEAEEVPVGVTEEEDPVSTLRQTLKADGPPQI